MNTLFRFATALAGAVLLSACGSPALVESAAKLRPALSCTGYPQTNTNSTKVCELRTFSNLPATGAARMRVDAGQLIAGGGSVTALTLRAYVYATGPTQSDAQATAAQVQIHTAGNDFYASGPAQDSQHGWSVSFDADLPAQTSLTASVSAGNMYLEALDGSISADAAAGNLNLVSLSGTLQSSASSGNIDIDLGGSSWSGSGASARADAGNVTFHAPPDYSAHFVLTAQTGNAQSDFPGTCSTSTSGASTCDVTTGSGSATLSGSVQAGNAALRLKP